MRQALTTLVFLLPPSRLKNRLLRRLGHVIPDTAVVGINLVRRVDRFELGEGSLIHHFNMFRDLRLVKMGIGCRIMLFTRSSATPATSPARRRPTTCARCGWATTPTSSASTTSTAAAA
ncbi:hypothetical protein F9L07_10605 [Pimelobacter simplex]|uniref:Uncharacterized protein n=1 Tax=Nocardioides simplex TaxID=2045 RepID=A0A7J5E1X5_NOCSI|nr:hypothetical protein [Pimelobacter simplex]KAB2812246.1 hypothetical protein F9L07_10605 [Pimelobacter simplex]